MEIINYAVAMLGACFWMLGACCNACCRSTGIATSVFSDFNSKKTVAMLVAAQHGLQRKLPALVVIWPQALGLFRVIPSHPARPQSRFNRVWAVLM